MTPHGTSNYYLSIIVSHVYLSLMSGTDGETIIRCRTSCDFVIVNNFLDSNAFFISLKFNQHVQHLHLKQ